jgi:hypothetical protein
MRYRSSTTARRVGWRLAVAHPQRITAIVIKWFTEDFDTVDLKDAKKPLNELSKHKD